MVRVTLNHVRLPPIANTRSPCGWIVIRTASEQTCFDWVVFWSCSSFFCKCACIFSLLRHLFQLSTRGVASNWRGRAFWRLWMQMLLQLTFYKMFSWVRLGVIRLRYNVTIINPFAVKSPIQTLQTPWVVTATSCMRHFFPGYP